MYICITPSKFTRPINARLNLIESGGSCMLSNLLNTSQSQISIFQVKWFIYYCILFFFTFLKNFYWLKILQNFRNLASHLYISKMFTTSTTKIQYHPSTRRLLCLFFLYFLIATVENIVFTQSRNYFVVVLVRLVFHVSCVL